MKLIIIINKYMDLIIVLTLTLLLYIFNDYSNTIISGDAEPDYIANSFNIISFYKPLGFHHPGTINYYFLSGTLYLCKTFSLSIQETIIICRLSYWFILSIIVIRITNANKIDDFIIKYLICLIIFLTIPELRELIFKVSAEALIFPITILLYYFYIYDDKIKFAIIFGLLLNIKFNCILLLPFLIQKLKNENIRNKILIFSLPLIIYFITTYPVANSFEIIFLPAYQTVLRIYIIFKNYLIFDVKFLFVSTLIIIIFLYYIIKKLNNYYHLNINNTINFFLITLFLYNNQMQIFRHFFPLIIFSILSINVKNIIKHKKAIFFIFLILIVTRTIENIKNNIKEHPIDKYIKNQKGKCYIFQASNFKSRILFLKWAEYRYANSNKVIPNDWYLDEGIEVNKINYLNTRNVEQKREGENIFSNALYSSVYKYNSNFNIQIKEMILNKEQIIIDKDHDSEFISIIIPLVKKINSNIKLIQVYEAEEFKSYILN